MFATIQVGIFSFRLPCENVKITIHTLQMCFFTFFVVVALYGCDEGYKRKNGTQKGKIEESQRKLHNEEVRILHKNLSNRR